MTGERPRESGRTSTAGSGRWGPRLVRHPLLGSDLSTLLASLRRHGFVAPARLPHLLSAVASGVLRWPFRAVEQWWARRWIDRHPPPSRPLFVVGHWRSGTTHLYNVLSRDPRFAYPHPIATGLPWEFLTVGRLLRPLLVRTLPESRWVDAIAVNPDSPQEDEVALANMQPLSFYHGVYFPRGFREAFYRGVFFDGCSREEVEEWKRALLLFLGKLRMEGSDGRLLVKNPVYTARVKLLKELFPDARFVHIRRNPFDVFASTLRFWRVLLSELAWQEPDRLGADELEEIVLDAYVRMMRLLERDTAALAGDEFVEVSLEELVTDPLPVVEKIYGQLELAGFRDVAPRFRAYLDSLGEYRKRSYDLSPDTVDRIRSRWGPFLERWGYGVPA